MAKTLIWLAVTILLFGGILTQRLNITNPNNIGICKGGLFRDINDLKSLKGCSVILGKLEIFIERGNKSDYNNLTFWELREITEYLVIYRVRGLVSVGKLFPNLTRIRGIKLLNNFGLIVYDNANLREIGLYSLLKIDRGGVTMWELPQACFVDTIDWKVLAPNARHVINPPDRQIQCSIPCTCSRNASSNRCWNNMKCQLFLDGPDADKCNTQCLGCRKVNKDICFVCRHYTHKGQCVSQCPPDAILLQDNQYCITEDECHGLGRWVWNRTCVSQCPMDYRINNKTTPPFCEPCTHCEITCKDLRINSLSAIQSAEKCVYINGSLIIHINAIPGVMHELKAYLGQIQEVSHYISMEGSDVTTLDFLSSLRLIKGEKLKDDKYSLVINHNHNLQTLFSPTVIKNLKINNGTARFEHNPVLCMSKIDELVNRFSILPNSIEIPTGSNGYRGGCKDVSFEFAISVINDSSVSIKFSPIVQSNQNKIYSALYVRLPPGVDTMIVPETCSEFEWHTVDIPKSLDKNYGVFELTELKPASTYALCIEIYDCKEKRLVRSNIFNFSTPVGTPEPPFIVELVASSSGAVVLRWVDHRDYVLHIDYYELDVALIEKDSRKSATVNYCQYTEDLFDTDYTRHALVRRPPPEYLKGCESMCGVLSSLTPGAMVEEYFDVCDDIGFNCNYKEAIISNNSTIGNYVRTLVLNITSPRSVFRIGGLAPYSDYKFRLRTCSGNHCSRFAKGVVRTFRLKNADVPTIAYAYANEFGHIYVTWNPPNVTNGPILAYAVEVIPQINDNNLMPQAWCVIGGETRIFVKSVIIPNYLVRVCVKTLASSNSCSDWMELAVATESKTIMLWMGVICGIFIYIASCVVGWIKRRLRSRGDVVPLVDSSVSWRIESEPPHVMLSDFGFHNVPLD